jgi:rhomboid protease GluP
LSDSLPPPSRDPETPIPPTPVAPVLIGAHMLEPQRPVESRADFERGISYAPQLTLSLIVVNIAVFGWELATGALESEQSIIAAGALSRKLVLEGEVWRLVTPIFLHAGFEHLIGNCVALYMLGMACEHGFGILRTLLMYLVSGIGGTSLSVVMSPGPSVGASGAIFGLMGAMIVFFHRYKHRFFVRDKRIGFVLLFWAIYTVGTGFFSPEIDNWAHIGGFIVGASAASFLPARLSRT